MEHQDQLPQEDQQMQSGLFEKHKSPEEIKAEAKAKALAEKQALKEARRIAKATHTKGERNTVMWVMIAILAAVVVIVAVMLAIQLKGSPRDMADNSPHFQRTEDTAELSEEGIKGVITEAYYTKGKQLCLKLNLSNGLASDQYLTTLEVAVSNEDEKVIATGYTDTIKGITYKDTMEAADYEKKDGFYVPANGYATFTFYIEEKYVKIADDDLSDLTYEIKTTGLLKDATALSNTTGTASAAVTEGSATTAAQAATTVAP